MIENKDVVQCDMTRQVLIILYKVFSLTVWGTAQHNDLMLSHPLTACCVCVSKREQRIKHGTLLLKQPDVGWIMIHNNKWSTGSSQVFSRPSDDVLAVLRSSVNPLDDVLAVKSSEPGWVEKKMKPMDWENRKCNIFTTFSAKPFCSTWTTGKKEGKIARWLMNWVDEGFRNNKNMQHLCRYSAFHAWSQSNCLNRFVVECNVCLDWNTLNSLSRLV